MEDKKLIRNSVICLSCGEKLVSNHRHDFVKCDCDNGTYCAGGLDYQLYGGKKLELIVTDNVYSDAPFEIIRNVLMRGSRRKDGKQPLVYIALKDIDDEYLQVIIDYEELHRPNNIYLELYKQEKTWRRQKK
jgi:hypothetical protein